MRAKFVAPVIGVMALLGLTVGVQPARAATFTVNTTADTVDASPGNGICADGSGDCSLRAAIMEANASGGTDGILLPPGVFTLTIAGTTEDAAATGDLDITTDISIVGAGQRRTAIDGAGIDRVFDVFSPASAQISQLTVRNGQPEADCEGGGIRNQAGAALTLNLVSVRSNTTTGPGVDPCATSTFFPEGGGLFNNGTLTLANTSFIGNTSRFGGGGLMNSSTGTVSASHVSFTGNTTQASNGGGFYNVVGSITMSYGTFTSNTADGSGGGFRNINGSVTMSHITLTGNQALTGNGGGFRSSDGGVLTIDDCKISGNSAVVSGGGFRAGGNFTMTNCSVTRNTVGPSSGPGGGGLRVSDGTVQLTNVYISNNVATNKGGGVFVTSGATLTLTGVTVTRNTAGVDGGGVFNDGGSVNFINSHVMRNNPNNCVGTATCPN